MKRVNNKKQVYICGLDGDFKRDKFGKMLDLIPLCDKVTKLSAICVKCKHTAIFSKRLTKEEVWDKPIVTEITALNNFYRAEQYHHD